MLRDPAFSRGTFVRSAHWMAIDAKTPGGFTVDSAPELVGDAAAAVPWMRQRTVLLVLS